MVLSWSFAHYSLSSPSPDTFFMSNENIIRIYSESVYTRYSFSPAFRYEHAPFLPPPPVWWCDVNREKINCGEMEKLRGYWRSIKGYEFRIFRDIGFSSDLITCGRLNGKLILAFYFAKIRMGKLERKIVIRSFTVLLLLLFLFPIFIKVWKYKIESNNNINHFLFLIHLYKFQNRFWSENLYYIRRPHRK